MAVSVLMVCLGNICRSPLAEAALRQHAEARGLELFVDSAGMGDWHVGERPDPRSQDVAKRLGNIDIRQQRARQVLVHDFHQFDHIIAMERSNLRELRAMMPDGAKAELSLLLEHMPGVEDLNVLDPYYGTTADFDHVWRLVDAAAEVLAGKLG